MALSYATQHVESRGPFLTPASLIDSDAAAIIFVFFFTTATRAGSVVIEDPRLFEAEVRKGNAPIITSVRKGVAVAGGGNIAMCCCPATFWGMRSCGSTRPQILFQAKNYGYHPGRDKMM